MYDEKMIENYSKLEDTFNKALNILEYEELPLNIETLDGILLELDDRIDKSINLSPRERNELFLMDFYTNFLDIFYPRIIEIISKNETDIILSPALLPAVNELNQKFVIELEEMLKKYGLTKSTLMIDEPFLKSLTDFRSLFLKRLKPYPDFDYNLQSWKNKKQQIHHKLRLTELNLISKLGKDYQEYMKSFEAAIIKKELVTLITYFKLEERTKTK